MKTKVTIELDVNGPVTFVYDAVKNILDGGVLQEAINDYETGARLRVTSATFGVEPASKRRTTP